MNLAAMLKTTSGQVTLLSIGVFAILAVLIIPSYFIAIRPRRGTIEWMQRIDPPKFAALRVRKLEWVDLIWMLLSGFGAGFLRLLACMLQFMRRGWMEAFVRNINTLLSHQLLPCMILGVLLYLLLRSMTERPMPAVCGAVLGGLVQQGNHTSAMLVVLSLICLWRFAAADADMPLLLHSLWMLLSALFYGIAILRFWSLIWLAPIYVAAYLYAQVYRWRYTSLPNRGMALSISLLLVFFMAVGAILCAWVYYCRRYGMLSQVLDLQQFWTLVSAKISRRISHLIVISHPLRSFCVEDSILLLLGMASIPPIVHSGFSRLDARCFALLALLPCFLAVWLLGSMYLLMPLMAMAWAWVCDTLLEREYPSLAVSFTALSVVAFLAEYYI